jgi:hypothetical protein
VSARQARVRRRRTSSARAPRSSCLQSTYPFRSLNDPGPPTSGTSSSRRPEPPSKRKGCPRRRPSTPSRGYGSASAATKAQWNTTTSPSTRMHHPEITAATRAVAAPRHPESRAYTPCHTIVTVSGHTCGSTAYYASRATLPDPECSGIQSFGIAPTSLKEAKRDPHHAQAGAQRPLHHACWHRDDTHWLDS